MTDAPTATQRTSTRLRELIAADRLPPGARLPPEHVLTARLGVSRTVLREAVAGLRAQGMLTSRRGSGVFVADAAPDLLGISPAESAGIPDVLDLLELRAAVEIEAAGLAARRHTAPHMQAIWAAYQRLEAHRDTGLDAEADFRFHHAIAAAAGNPRFAWFLDVIGRTIIPRQRLRHASDPATASGAYAALLQSEHHALATAIEARDAALARDAMRLHLAGSAARYKAFLSRKEET